MPEPAADLAVSARPTAARRFGPVGCLTLSFLLLVLLLVALPYGWRAAGARRAEAELAKIRELGQPVTAEELSAFYEAPPPALDCTGIWLAAFQPLDGPEYSAATEPLPIVGLGPHVPPLDQEWPQLDAAEKFLEKYEGSVRQMHEAAARGGAARYDVPFHAGLRLLLNHLQGVRDAARILSLEAQVRAHRGDAAGAADSIDALFKLGVSLENEPNLVSQLTKLATDGIARGQIQSVLPYVEFPDEDLQRLREDLQRIDYFGGLHRALLGQRVVDAIAFEDPGDLDMFLGRGSNLAWRITQTEDFAAYLTFMARLIAAAERPWPQGRDEVAVIAGEVESLVEGSRLSQFRHMVTGNLFPSIETMIDALVRDGLQNAAADAALATEMFRRRHGRLPSDLNELVPEFLESVPLDRYDGQPLRYVVRDDECLIYSLGENGVDDGGAIDFPPRGMPPDWGFRLAIPAAGE